jgi:anti-sigma regulatory factor (Ser/Thr protein kinase)/GNAT superfamily N-acetyltransferase
MNDEKTYDFCKLTIPNNIAYLSVISNFVRGVAKLLNFDEKDQQKIDLAVEEAVTNVIEHAFSPDEKATFDIICKNISKGLEITIHDEGLPFDPSQHKKFSSNYTNMDSVSDEGLGSFLIKEMMDEFEFKNLGASGKETRFVKYFDTASVLEGLDDHELEISDPQEQATEKSNFTMRKMQAEDAVEISRCVYDSYGYSYANEHIYYPDRIANMNETGALMSAVAVSDTGEIGGHFALIVYEKLPTEIGIAATKKKFRGQKIAAKLGEFLANEARLMNLKGLQVREVTVHPYTQKFCKKLGYTDCGFLLAHSPTTMSFKGIADNLHHRNTDIVAFKYFDSPEKRTVYAPVKHQAIIEELYINLNVPVTFEKSLKELPDCRTESDIKANSIRSVCEIHIPVYGKDIVDTLKCELSTMRKNEIKVAEMYLNLMNPLTPFVVEEAEKLGFFFTGILPETGDCDSIIMQYLNGIQMDYEIPTIVSKTAQKLLKYIKQHDPHHQ